MSLTDAFMAHIADLERRGIAGDDGSIRSLGAILLLMQGWRPGDDEPDGGYKPVDLAVYRLKLRLAA